MGIGMSLLVFYSMSISYRRPGSNLSATRSDSLSRLIPAPLARKARRANASGHRTRRAADQSNTEASSAETLTNEEAIRLAEPMPHAPGQK
jgi:hypothetical protein